MTRLIVVVGVLAATGYIHGRWTDRWGEVGDITAAAAAMPKVPLTVGDWDGRDVTREESEWVYRTATPQIIRRYVNRQSGAVVGFLLTCGRPGSMIIEHTPRACYGELGFEEVGEGQRLAAGPPQAKSEVYAHTFTKVTPAATTRLRLFWSWGNGSTWAFPNRPRLAFARTPVLYKVYITRDLLSENEPVADDPAIGFLDSMLPEITAVLSRPSR